MEHWSGTLEWSTGASKLNVYGGCMEKQETETDAERGNEHQKRKTTFTNSYLQTRRASISSLEHS